MYKIETKHHIIETNNNDKPAFTCTGPCESVWWKNDIPPYNPLEVLHCSKCGGVLRAAKPEDYKVIEFMITPQSVKEAKITLKHEVKSGSEDFAREHWC